MREQRSIVPVDPVEEFGRVLVDGSNEVGRDFAVPFSIEFIKARKYLNIDVSLTRFSMRLNHGRRQCRTVEACRKDLQISNKRPQVAVVCFCKRVNGRFLKFNALFTQDPTSNSA